MERWSQWLLENAVMSALHRINDIAWIIVLFGGLPAALIFLFWWIRRWDQPER